MIDSLAGWGSTIRSALRRALRPPMHRADIRRPYVHLGTDYGGWPLLTDTERGALLFSFGVGEDISFDLAAIDRFGCRVHAFDPTPRSMEWISRQSLPVGLTYHPAGIAKQDGHARFEPPENDRHVSFSTFPAGDAPTERSIEAPVKRLATFVAEIGAGLPKVVKMDIEGFEYEVIDDMIAGPLRPEQFLVEFHHGLYGFTDRDTLKAVASLRAAGYGLFFVSSSGREYGFVWQRSEKMELAS